MEGLAQVEGFRLAKASERFKSSGVIGESGQPMGVGGYDHPGRHCCSSCYPKSVGRSGQSKVIETFLGQPRAEGGSSGKDNDDNYTSCYACVRHPTGPFHNMKICSFSRKASTLALILP